MGVEVVAHLLSPYLMLVPKFPNFLGKEVVGLEAGGLNVGVEGRADLSLRSVEFGLKGGFATGEFVVENAVEVVGTFGDFRVEGFVVLVETFFHELGELLIEGVFTSLVGEARSRVCAEFVFLGVYPSLEAWVKGSYKDCKGLSRWIIRDDRVSYGGDEVGTLGVTPCIYLGVHFTNSLIEECIPHGAGIKVH
jgi:hypothetical protein